jgi:prepilin-type N-terminal cleavage/methylation domain-containing protein
MPKKENGFTLVELIVTIVLIGIIGTFTTLFVYTGLNGYLRAKDNSEGALKAQIALDRISMELRDIDFIDLATYEDDSKIDYTSVMLPGNRQISFNGSSISLDVDGSQNELLDNVTAFTMNLTSADLNNSGDTVNEIKAINVSFNVGDIGRVFSASIFPRNMLPAPP